MQLRFTLGAVSAGRMVEAAIIGALAVPAVVFLGALMYARIRAGR